MRRPAGRAGHAAIKCDHQGCSALATNVHTDTYDGDTATRHSCSKDGHHRAMRAAVQAAVGRPESQRQL